MVKLNLNPMKKRPPHPQRPPHLRPLHPPATALRFPPVPQSLLPPPQPLLPEMAHPL
jgi:hypothetical protein